MSSYEPEPLDIDDKIDASGCGESYRRLDECIVVAERDWRKCRNEVELFKICMQRVRKSKKVKEH